tara:strand:+ start:11617 stop:12906 length:1290 start_codon:yes stop_codon:yes gene_type:complete
MAVTSTIEYCTDREVKDVFPNISGFDLKQRLYNFTSLGNNVYVAYNTGLVTQLYKDGQEMNAVASTGAVGTWSTATTANILASPTASESSASLFNEISYNASFSAGSEGDIKPGSYGVLVGNTEYVYIQAVDTDNNKLTVSRAALGTSASAHSSTVTIAEWLEVNETNHWYYDSYLDHCLLYSTTNPNDSIVETGDDWSTIKTRFRRKASRFVESLLDSRIAREISKDREGNYPEVIVRMTALKTVVFLLQAHDPTNEFIEPFQEEFNELLDGIRNGHIVLPNQVSRDSSKGVIRHVSVNASTTLFPVELRGNYSRYGYDLLKIYIDSGEGGAIGTARMTVKAKDSDQLKNDVIVDSEIITGDFQPLASGLQIRWSAGVIDGSTDVATAGDEYEIEVYSTTMDATVSNVGSVGLSRGGRGYYSHSRRKR